jgi:hypothetical protein
MKLCGYIRNGQAPHSAQDFRDLSVEELKHNARFRPVVAEARSRLTLFRVLDENFREWTDYLQSLLHPRAVNDDVVVLNLERLLLNYLACAYHIRAHFEASFQQRFRTDGSEQKKYKMLVENLGQSSWPFAFFLDFRNLIQHQGLGLGFYRRQVTPTSVSLEITLNAAELLQTTKDWPRSKLTPAKGVLELITLLRDFHAVMLQKYSGIVIQTLFADLPPAVDFYKKLAAEVREKDPALVMALRENAPHSSGEARLIFVPNDLLAELGLAGAVGK